MKRFEWRGAAATAAILAGLAPATVFAHDHEHDYPAFSGVIPIELQYDNTYDSTAPGNEASDLYFTIEPEFVLEANEWLSFTAGLVFEPVEDLDPYEDRAFEDHGLFVETLKADIALDPVTITLGKFTPAFAYAVDVVPGVVGDLFAEDVEVTERIGAGISAEIETDGAGTFLIGGSAFFRDTTFLSDSAFESRGELDEADGGIGNTEDLSNFVINAGLSDAFGAKGLTLHGAFMHQAGGAGDLSDQDAYLLAASWDFVINEEDGVVLTPVVEWAHSEDAVGFGDAASAPGADQSVLTLGLGLTAGPWNVAAVYGDRDTEDPGLYVGGDVDEEFWQLSAGYAFDFGLGLDLGVGGYEDNAGTDDEFFTALLTYEIAFGGEEE
ncbi:MAG: hypothetical protein HXY22_07975 [Alphaproteobacteria bacterium]|nr:hypothetical protein [Alphaproteobacteria bacterium]